VFISSQALTVKGGGKKQECVLPTADKRKVAEKAQFPNRKKNTKAMNTIERRKIWRRNKEKKNDLSSVLHPRKRARSVHAVENTNVRINTQTSTVWEKRILKMSNKDHS